MIVGIFDGIIKKFNEKFPRQAVKKFDKISAVNGKAGTSNEMRRTGATVFLHFPAVKLEMLNLQYDA